MSYVPAIEAELRRVGVASWSVSYGRHIKIRFTWQGKPVVFVTLMSPSDAYRGQKNALADLRRILGVKAERRKSERAPKATAPRVHKPPTLSGATVPDWREKLRALTSVPAETPPPRQPQPRRA